MQTSHRTPSRLGGEKYVSCLVVQPSIVHLLKVLRVSDDDPPYAARFESVFTKDLESRRDASNIEWLKVATALDPSFKSLKYLP